MIAAADLIFFLASRTAVVGLALLIVRELVRQHRLLMAGDMSAFDDDEREQ